MTNINSLSHPKTRNEEAVPLLVRDSKLGSPIDWSKFLGSEDGLPGLGMTMPVNNNIEPVKPNNPVNDFTQRTSKAIKDSGRFGAIPTPQQTANQKRMVSDIVTTMMDADPELEKNLGADKLAILNEMKNDLDASKPIPREKMFLYAKTIKEISQSSLKARFALQDGLRDTKKLINSNTAPDENAPFNPHLSRLELIKEMNRIYGDGMGEMLIGLMTETGVDSSSVRTFAPTDVTPKSVGEAMVRQLESLLNGPGGLEILKDPENQGLNYEDLKNHLGVLKTDQEKKEAIEVILNWLETHPKLQGTSQRDKLIVCFGERAGNDLYQLKTQLGATVAGDLNPPAPAGNNNGIPPGASGIPLPHKHQVSNPGRDPGPPAKQPDLIDRMRDNLKKFKGQIVPGPLVVDPDRV